MSTYEKRYSRYSSYSKCSVVSCGAKTLSSTEMQIAVLLSQGELAEVKFRWILHVVQVHTDQFWIVILSRKNFGTLHYSPRVSPKAVNHCSLCCQSPSFTLIDWIFLQPGLNWQAACKCDNVIQYKCGSPTVWLNASILIIFHMSVLLIWNIPEA